MSARLVTIRHSHADGTLIEGTTRADRGLHQAVKAYGFRFSRTLGCWYLPHSRDKHADRQRLDQTAAALRDAGATVEVVLDDTPRDAAAREADRHERLEGRRERLAGRADRLGGQADAAYQRGHQMLDAIPLGQPLLPDHHSYGRDRNYRERARRTMDRAFELAGESETAAERAAASRAAEAHRLGGPATMRRIDKLEADRRRLLRGLKGRVTYTDEGPALVAPSEQDAARLRAALAQVDDDLACWRAHLQQLKAGGQFTQYGPADFKRGDRVQVEGWTGTVLRVNRKTLTVHRDGLPAVLDGPVDYSKVRPLPQEAPRP